MGIFNGMQPGEQAHALNILHRLLKQGENHPDLLAAALLHDCGKQRYPLNPLERAWIVLVYKFSPERAKAWGRGNGNAVDHLPIWQRSLVVAEQHPAWGAEMVQQAGASPLLLTLIRRHQERLDNPASGLENELLHKLQVVDNEN
jgi:hypothetical protein